MSEDSARGRHAADDADAARADAARADAGAGSPEPAGSGAAPSGPDADRTIAIPTARGGAEYARPDGLSGGFAPHEPPPAYTAPPPTVSPADRAVYGNPGDGASFAPAPGERLAPSPTRRPPVPGIFADMFGAGPEASGGFAPAPGDRMAPSGPQPESPWWKPGADRDPWRDPASSFWLGRGAVFTRGRPEQLDPAQDESAEDELLDGETPDEQLEAEQAPAQSRGKYRFGLSTFAIFGVLTLVAALLGGGVGWYLQHKVHSALHRPDVSIAQVHTPTDRPAGSIASVAKRVGPAVVSILIQTPDEFAIGSGVVIDSDGDILTNNHVVAPAAGVSGASIVVTFSNENTAKATIVGRDPISDLAVIKVPNDQLTVATLGKSSELAVGDSVIAIGSPLGLQGTVTAGIVSALNRPVHVSNDDGSSDAYLNAIQTDAAINPGNSGGALVNSSGAVIGINSAGAQGTSGPNGTGSTISGIGYAIPIDYAHEIALELIHTGKAVHATLGAVGSTAVAGLQVGGYVKQVDPGGPAAQAGLKPGDVIVSVDGQVVQTFDQLTVAVQMHKPGDKITLEYYADKASTKTKTVVTLG